MSDRIDPAAEARRSLGLIKGVDEQTNQITLALEAQVHATLALVEQQRIANLIALSEHQTPPRHHPGALREDVREGLGL
ncbi:hypothetical protein PTQ19_10145 [Microbacterium esteraromaticum]|uniref:hypothetical protein n=1 Tax=Microbacterium esteraromaticum TaxID=57043 RepID=UPI00236810E1|nr:hypothetical protein [Microbacterium esteraromaticum]WDH77881.1 hypothetical protein PTQ19_10145 [Microbacterium esteraromaticum]